MGLKTVSRTRAETANGTDDIVITHCSPGRVGGAASIRKVKCREMEQNLHYLSATLVC